MSTRELRIWIEYYQNASAEVREKLVTNPGLAIRARQENKADQEAEGLRKDPVGRWLRDTRLAQEVLTRMQGNAWRVLDATQAALRLLDGTCPVCVVDNTRVLVAAGSGPHALISKMEANFMRGTTKDAPYRIKCVPNLREAHQCCLTPPRSGFVQHELRAVPKPFPRSCPRESR